MARHLLRVTFVTYCLLCYVFIAVGARASTAAGATPVVALFEINGSTILSTTDENASTSFGWRSRFFSRFDPAPAVSVASLTYSTAEHASGPRVFDFLAVPYCTGSGSTCDLRGHVLYLSVRFRQHQEVYFQAGVWQDGVPTRVTLRALADFKATLNRTDVIFPRATSTRRIEDAATCSAFTDECYLAASATYTRSYKELDPRDYSARFLFRVGETYSMNSPLRVRLQHSLPHDSEAAVDVVIVLARLPAFNPLNPRWWAERVSGRFALLLLGGLVCFGFLAVTREVSAQLSRRRSGAAAAPAPYALYLDDDDESHFTYLQCVSAVACGAARRAAAAAQARLGGLHERLPGLPSWRRRRLPTSEEASASVEREIETVAARPPSDDEEAGPLCRICRSREPADDLFAPCACNGSSKYVHHACLEQWREVTSNPDHRRVCAECKTPYTLVRVHVPQSADLLTSSSIIEPAVRHYSATFFSAAATVVFAASGAYWLKGLFFVGTGLDWHMTWSLTEGYHWVLTVYFLLALALNRNIMHPFVKDMASPELQLLFVVASLALIEIPISYSTSAFFTLFFDGALTWEVSYGVGLFATALLHLLEVFANFDEMLSSLAPEREVVAPRTEAEEAERPAAAA